MTKKTTLLAANTTLLFASTKTLTLPQRHFMRFYTPTAFITLLLFCIRWSTTIYVYYKCGFLCRRVLIVHRSVCNYDQTHYVMM